MCSDLIQFNIRAHGKLLRKSHYARLAKPSVKFELIYEYLGFHALYFKLIYSF